MGGKPSPCQCGGSWRESCGADKNGRRRFQCRGCGSRVVLDADGAERMPENKARACPECDAKEWKTTCTVGVRQYRTCKACGHRGQTHIETGEILQARKGGQPKGSKQAAGIHKFRTPKPKRELVAKPAPEPIKIARPVPAPKPAPAPAAAPAPAPPAKGSNTRRRIDDLMMQRELLRSDPLFD